MHPLLNHLIQLQELILIRGEQEVAGHRGHLEKLDESITDMTGGLPKQVSTTFNRLHQRDHNVVVPVTESGCSVCGMKLPRSLVQAIKLGRDLESCPNCSRFLYIIEGAPRNTRARPGRFDRPKPGVARFSSEALMVPRLKAKDRDGVIRELTHCMAEAGFVTGEDLLVEEALRRETILSTAVDHGLAFPHVRGVEGGGLTLAVGMNPDGVAFDGKGDPTRIVFFLVIPTAASAFYLKLLAGLTETFMKQGARDQLLECEDAETLWKTLIKVTRKTIK